MKKNGLFEKLFYEGSWACAIRKHNPLFLTNPKDNKTAFNIIRFRHSFWGADPFIFSINGEEIYLFVEFMNTKKTKATIGVKQIYPIQSKCNNILEFDGHASYPCIFENDGKIYMIPETSYSRTVRLFECVEFPFEWKEKSVLLSCDKKLVDSTPFFIDNKCYLFLFETFDEIKDKKLFIGELDLLHGTLSNIKLVKHYSESTGRPGGMTFKNGGYNYRVVQPSRHFYGEKIELYRFSYKNDKYYEELVDSISLNDISLDDKKNKYIGIHTYNFHSNLEVIDLKCKKKFNLFKPLILLFKKMNLFGFGYYEDGRKIYK